jgi:hypothetical protein
MEETNMTQPNKDTSTKEDIRAICDSVLWTANKAIESCEMELHTLEALVNKHKGKRELAKDILYMVNKRNSKGASRKENED